MPTFSGVLNPNKIQSALFNMIISQDVIGGSIKANYNLVDKARVDGTLYGDTKLYIDCPTVDSYAWEPDTEDSLNVLAIKRPGAPKTQAITMGVYRQCMITKDDYLSKQAFGTEGAFVQYQSIIEARLPKSKEVYENTTYNAFFGTVEGAHAAVEVALSDIAATGVEKTRLEAEMIAQAVADLIADMKDYGYDYTKNGFLRAFSEDEIQVVWNVKFLNKIRKISLPNIYHKENLIDKFGGESLPARFFGEVKTTATEAGDNDGTLRALVEKDYVVGGVTKHVMAGSLIPAGVAVAADEAYVEDEDVICKVYTKLPPMMSAFSVGTSFFNAKNLSSNSYLTWGHNKLEALDSEAIVTVHAD